MERTSSFCYRKRLLSRLMPQKRGCDGFPESKQEKDRDCDRKGKETPNRLVRQAIRAFTQMFNGNGKGGGEPSLTITIAEDLTQTTSWVGTRRLRKG